jgi:hypothetical protein
MINLLVAGIQNLQSASIGAQSDVPFAFWTLPFDERFILTYQNEFVSHLATPMNADAEEF